MMSHFALNPDTTNRQKTSPGMPEHQNDVDADISWDGQIPGWGGPGEILIVALSFVTTLLSVLLQQQ